jgi:hypothetical protein
MTDPQWVGTKITDELDDKEVLNLVRLVEELAELSMATTKMLRFGPYNYHPDRPNSSNIAEWRREIDDVIAVLKEMREFPTD